MRIVSDYGVWLANQEAVIIVHVDDMQLLGSQSGLEHIIGVLANNLLIKRMGPTGTYLFLGLQIERNRPARQITIYQSIYARQILSRFVMSDCTSCSTPMDPKEDWTPKEGNVPL